MYYKLDKNGFYWGIKSETNEGMEFYTTEIPTKIGAVNEEFEQVPEQVPLWCLRQILIDENLFDDAVQKMSSLEEPTRTKALNFFEYGNFVNRNSPTIEILGQLLGKSKTEIDNLFIKADKINL